MSAHTVNPAMPVQSAPDANNSELDTVLTYASALSPYPDDEAVRQSAKRIAGRLSSRVSVSLRAESAKFNVRQRDVTKQWLAPGVSSQTLYRAQQPTNLRPGEPLLVLQIDLSPSATLTGSEVLSTLHADIAGVHIEWLIMSGQAQLLTAGLSVDLSQRDYHVTPADFTPPNWHSALGAKLFVRVSKAEQGMDEPLTVKDADAGWPDFIPGIKRRILWQQGTQAAMLYYAQPGVGVPNHVHHHDEECLMLQGDLFLDDLLLQAGDYQLAPVGTDHHITETDTGAVIYANGDLDLDIQA